MANNAVHKNIIALIPARGGSQRVKNKNIRQLSNKPLIGYTIESALKAKNIDRVIVSTDNHEIAKIALGYGAEVPFLRPEKFATADSTEFDFHNHTLESLEKLESYKVDIIVNLYPTSPFRKTETINNALDLFLLNPNADSLRSVRKCKEHPYKMWIKDGKHLRRFVSIDDASKQTLSYHLLPEVYIQNSSIYIVKSETLLKYKNTIGENTLFFEMEDLESLDINYEVDYEFAEFIIKKNMIK
jgi:CMP-N,N'-diacetyllegionaminic acid synthase